MKALLRICTIRAVIVLFWSSVIFIFLNIGRIPDLLFARKSISVCIWPMILDPQVLKQFETQTGIKVHLNYYESNEELLSKLQATHEQGYDLIVPTDYMVQKLIQKGMLKKLDATKLPFKKDIRPYLQGNYYDSFNEYSIPYYVSVFGLGINKNYFGGTVPPASWNLVFDKNHAVAHMSMIDSAREAIMLAAFYKYGTVENLTPEQLHEVQNILITQKQWLDLYTSSRVEELLASGSCPLAVGTNADIWKAQREYSNIEFVIPQEGSFVTVDSFVIPVTTQQDDLVYQFINFLYQENILQHNSNKYGFCSPLNTQQEPVKGIMCLDEQQFKKLHFFKNVVPSQQIQDIWIAVKAQ